MGAGARGTVLRRAADRHRLLALHFPASDHHIGRDDEACLRLGDLPRRRGRGEVRRSCPCRRLRLAPAGAASRPYRLSRAWLVPALRPADGLVRLLPPGPDVRHQLSNAGHFAVVALWRAAGDRRTHGASCAVRLVVEGTGRPAADRGDGAVIAVILVAFFVLIALSIPMAIAIGLAVVLGLMAASPFPATIMFQKMIAGTDNFILVAIPLFILTGNLMNAAGITDRIFTFVRNCIGFVPGGLAYTSVGSSVVFAGMNGSAVADAASLGKMQVKAMRDSGYTTDFAAALTAASSVIGPIIPPSIPFILYGALAEVSIGKLFAAGILPGLLFALVLCVWVAI